MSYKNFNVNTKILQRSYKDLNVNTKNFAKFYQTSQAKLILSQTKDFWKENLKEKLKVVPVLQS